MAFKLNKHNQIAVDTPEALFRDLRNRQVAGLLSHQADILRVYQERTLQSSDVALQLPTGSGKTLVGLLIAEWRRRKFQERVLYLCPTKQLVNQVVEQASKKYGIKTLGFTGKATAYLPTSKAEYQNAESIAVATYNALFNINPFFDSPQLIVFDDAHASENYIASHWSVNILKADHPRVFDAVVTLLRPKLTAVDHQKLSDPSKELWDTEWVEKGSHSESIQFDTGVDCYAR